MTLAKQPIFTLGHSTHSLEAFVALLRQHDVAAVADVHSSPYSRFNPQFNREPLSVDLKAQGIAYVFLGCQLGARSENPACYEKQFLLLMAARRVETLVDKDLIDGGCLLCSEVTPEHCHRKLVAEYFRDKWGDVEIVHL